MLRRNRHAANRLSGRGAVIRASLFCLAILLLGGCALPWLEPTRIPPGASYGPTRSSSPVVETARSVIGAPYRWGGDSPNEGFDCSGLVYWTFARHGVRMPRPSWEQINTGTPVGRNDLRAGDLVFFKIVRGSSYHVGIYTGRGTFVHSPKSGARVRESELASDYWRKRFVAARRIVR